MGIRIDRLIRILVRLEHEQSYHNPEYAVCQRLLPRLVLRHQPVVLSQADSLDGLAFRQPQRERSVYAYVLVPGRVLVVLAPE